MPQSSQLGANAGYIEDLYEQYLVAPDSVRAEWKAYFDGLARAAKPATCRTRVVMEQVADAGRRAARGLLDARRRPATRATRANAPSAS